MDPYRVRTGARFVGVALLLMVAVAFAFMQKSLLALRAEQVGRTSWIGTPNGAPAPLADASRLIHEMGGIAPAGAESGDLDGDGTEEILLVQPVPTLEAESPTVARVLVVSPRPGGKLEVRLDSSWASAAGELGSVSRWRPVRLGLVRIALEGLDLEGQPLGIGFEADWRRREQGFWQHVARIDRRWVAAYN